MFFNHYNSFRNLPCYLLARGIDQVDPFLLNLKRLIEEGSVPFTGLLTMNLLEVSPRPSQLQFLLSSTRSWLLLAPYLVQGLVQENRKVFPMLGRLGGPWAKRPREGENP